MPLSAPRQFMPGWEHAGFFGLEIQSLLDLQDDRRYREMDPAQRAAGALDEQITFIGQLFETARLTSVELRVLRRDADDRELAVSLLGSVAARSHEQGLIEAELRCGEIQRSAPRQIRLRPIEGDAELDGWLRPFAGRDVHIAEVRKREELVRPSRPDARVGAYYVVHPFNWSADTFERLYETILAHPAPLCFSVGLTPLAIPDRFRQDLIDLATMYGRLARPDRTSAGLYRGPRQLHPDSFAIDAERIVADSVRRYQGAILVTRIQFVSPEPVPDSLMHLAGSVISPAGRGLATHLDGARVGSSYALYRPPPSDAAAALDAFEQLLPANYGIDERPFQAGSYPGALRALPFVVDDKEANCAFRLPLAVHGSVPGLKTHRGDFAPTQILRREQRAIELGALPDGSTFTIPVDDLTMHGLIAGSTGAGKSTTALRILSSLWLDHQIPFLVIEPANSDHDQYRAFMGRRGFESMLVLTVGDESVAPFRMNPFEVPDRMLVGEHVSNLMSCFETALGLFPPLPFIYRRALASMYRRFGFTPAQRVSGHAAWPTLRDFARELRQVCDTIDYAGETRANILAASTLRMESLLEGAAGDVLDTPASFPVDALLDRPVVMELKHLGHGEEQALLMALILNAFTERYQVAWQPAGRLKHMTLIEEAHRLLRRPIGGKDAEQVDPSRETAEAFAMALSENRKYGAGILIAEQVPTKLVEDVLKNTALKIMHRLASADDREVMGNTMRLDDLQKAQAAALPTGEAAVYRLGMDRPAVVRVQQADVGVTLPDDNLVRDEMRHRFRADPRLAAARLPFESCDRCEHQCDYRGVSRQVAFDDELFERFLRLAKNKALARRDFAEVMAMLRVEANRFGYADPDRDLLRCLYTHLIARTTPRFRRSWVDEFSEHLGGTT